MRLRRETGDFSIVIDGTADAVLVDGTFVYNPDTGNVKYVKTI